MTSMPLPNEASQLAAALELGEPIRVYRTTKRRQFKISCWVLAFIYLVFIINLFAQTHFRITQIYVFVYYLGAAVMLALALSFFIPLLLIRKTTVYICASGFILYHKRKCQVVRWEDIEWVSSNNQSPHIVYLANKKRVILSQLIDNVQALAQEIEIKARLIKHPQGQETLEAQFEQLLRIQTTREQDAQLQKKPGPIEQESPEEAFKLQAEYQLGEVVATYHGGFRGILRANVLASQSTICYYLLLLSCLLE